MKKLLKLSLLFLVTTIYAQTVQKSMFVPILMDEILMFHPVDAKLLFKSGFENSVYIDSNVIEDSLDYRFIRGKDENTGFTWPLELFGSSESALHFVDSSDFDALQASIDTIIGHNNTYTKVLYNKENYREADGSTQLTYAHSKNKCN